MLQKPIHIVFAKPPIADNTLTFPWDEWDVKKAYQPADGKLMDRLDAISYRGNVGLTLAIAEWIYWRFEAVSDDPTLIEYIEAAWAQNTGLARCAYLEPNVEEWRGIVRGPQLIAWMIAIEVSFDYKDVLKWLGGHASWMSNLAEHVLTDPAPFLAWREACIERLEEHFPAVEDDPDDLFEELDLRGDPVPRELFDIARPYDPSEAEALCQQLVDNADWETNPFLFPLGDEDEEDDECC